MTMTLGQQEAGCTSARDAQGNPGRIETHDGKEGCIMNGAFGQFMVATAPSRASFMGSAIDTLRSWFSRP